MLSMKGLLPLMLGRYFEQFQHLEPFADWAVTH